MGVGFQNNLIFGEYLEGFAGGFLENGMTAGGMTAGGLTAILLTLFTEASRARRHRLRADLALSELPRIRQFLGDFATRHRADRAARLDRLIFVR